jgi:hypothetical protein
MRMGSGEWGIGLVVLFFKGATFRFKGSTVRLKNFSSPGC